MKSKKAYLIIGAVAFLSIIFIIFSIYKRNSGQIFTQPEYIKEVIIQKEAFDDLKDKFLDQVETYNGTKEADRKVDEALSNAEKFVTNLAKKLEPRVPNESKSHYESMMKAYRKYIEAMKYYQSVLPEKLSDERSNEIQTAEQKIHDADQEMLNLK